MTTYAKHRFHTLDGMRGIASVIVMLFHYCKLLYLWCFKNPIIAVDFFFVLSGFVIYHAYGDKIKQGMAVADYVARRLGRLYPIMAVSLLMGARVFYLHAMAAHTDYTRRDFAVTLITNLAMLPYLTAKNTGDRIPLFPSDGALWSISFEMFASLCFPLLLRLDNKRLRTFCLGCLFVLIVTALLHGVSGRQRLFDSDGGWNVDSLSQGFPRVLFGFSCGMLLYRMRAEAVSRNASMMMFSFWLLYGGLAAVLMFPSYVQGVYPLFALSVLAPLLVWCGSFAVCRDHMTTRVSEFLGWLSYPLYCLHMPVFDGVRYLDKNGDVIARSGIPESVIATGAGAAVAVSIVVGLLIDRLQLQRKLTGLLKRGFGYAVA